MIKKEKELINVKDLRNGKGVRMDIRHWVGISRKFVKMYHFLDCVTLVCKQLLD